MTPFVRHLCKTYVSLFLSISVFLLNVYTFTYIYSLFIQSPYQKTTTHTYRQTSNLFIRRSSWELYSQFQYYDLRLIHLSNNSSANNIFVNPFTKKSVSAVKRPQSEYVFAFLLIKLLEHYYCTCMPLKSPLQLVFKYTTNKFVMQQSKPFITASSSN